jgi:hypothetical protein
MNHRERAIDGVFALGGDEGDNTGIRGYRRGIPMRSIHCIATARQGQLMVRDRQSATSKSITVRLHPAVLLADDPVMEEAIARYASVVQSLVESGFLVHTFLGHRWIRLNRCAELPGFLDDVAMIDRETNLLSSRPAGQRDELVIGVPGDDSDWTSFTSRRSSVPDDPATRLTLSSGHAT